MKRIRNMLNKVKVFVKSNPKEVLAFGIFVVAITIFFIGNAFAVLTPTKSVIITSQKSSFEDKEPGSWQVEKSGKWIAKGKARVSFDVDTTLMTEDRDTDIIFVLDISGSMSGNKLDRVKQDSTELIDSLLSNKNNNAALITFDTGSTIVSDFTNDKDYLINEINNLEDTGSTNYYQPLVNVDTILKDYVKTDDKEVIVLFLTDGYPNEDTPNQIAQYQILKKIYPYITINGIQYEMGDTILEPIKEISDNQFFADMKTLNNVLFDASVPPISYDEFKIVDYIDNRYFTLKSVDDITVSQGNVKLEEENGKQKITWTIPSFKSGRDAKLTMDINLKDEYIGQGGIYPTNESEEIISKIVNSPDEDVVSTKTPVLVDNYKVIYDENNPDGSAVSNVPDAANYSVLDTVSLTTEEPSCVGYEFKGWEIVNKDVTRVGEDHFIMPEEDVVIRAKWSKVEVSKSMNGTVNIQGLSVMKAYTYNSYSDYHSIDYKDKVTSVVTKDNIYIPTTAIEYWDVSEAEDGSVIAYIEDDGTGNGTYRVTIGGNNGVKANPDSSWLFSGFENVKDIDLTYLYTQNVTDMDSMFQDCNNLVNLNIRYFDTSNVTNMYDMFLRCSSLTSLYLSGFDTSNVKNMINMFLGCSSLTSLDLSNFDTSKVTDMTGLFSGCTNLSKIYFPKKFGSGTTDMSYMFEDCSSLVDLDLSNFDTSNVIEMQNMFFKCESLQKINMNGWDTSAVEDMSGMFSNCSSIVDLDLRNFDTTSVVKMGTGDGYLDQGMFEDCTSLKNIYFPENFGSSNTNMSNMFRYCKSLENLDLRNFDVSSVKDMSYLFYNCESLVYINFPEDFGITTVDMNGMFEDCSSLVSLDLGIFDTKKVTNMGSMFNDCSSLTNLDITNFDTSNVTSMGYMFDGCSSLTNLDITNFDTSKVTSMYYMFNGCGSLTNIDVRFFVTTNVTSMSSMFSGCGSLTSLDVTNFDTSKVESMQNMFKGCNGLTSIDLSHFDTSSVSAMSGMFSGCSGLTELDLSNFNTSNVLNMGGMYDGDGMFENCSGLTSLDLGNFDTKKVTNMGSMFNGCSSLASLNISNFNTAKVTNMQSMFCGCSNLTSLDLSHFDISSVEYISSMFEDCNSLVELDVSNFGESKVRSTYYMFENCSSLTSLDLGNFDMSHVSNMHCMFDGCHSLIYLDISNSTLSSSYIHGDNDVFARINSHLQIVVKDSTSQSWVSDRIDYWYYPYVTITIANPATQTSLFELGPREFGPFYLVSSC